MSPLHVAVVVLVALAAEEKPAERVDASTLAPEAVERLAAHVKAKGLSPTDYLVKKFEKHDVVFLGETHWVRENCEVVSGSLDALYRRAGVRRLASEFFRSRFNERLKTIVTAPEYDEAAVVDILRQGPWPIWGFREYERVVHAAWKLNKSLPEKAEPFLVIGLDSDWSQYALWFGKLDRRKSFDMRLDRERHMGQVLDTESFLKNFKALVHVGSAHALTCHGERLGTVLTRKYGARIFQVHLHASLADRGRESALVPALERILAGAGGKPVGFDVAGSPLDVLHDPKVMWWRMMPESRFSAFAQGYLFLVPLDGLHRVSWIDGFVTDEMFEKARAVCEKSGWTKKGEIEAAKELNAVLAKRFAGGRIADE